MFDVQSVNQVSHQDHVLITPGSSRLTVSSLSPSQAPRPSTGPHKLRECLPLIIFLRNRLKYALTGDEVKKICMQRFIKIDGKVRTDITYPTGFMGESLHHSNRLEGCSPGQVYVPPLPP